MKSKLFRIFALSAIAAAIGCAQSAEEPQRDVRRIKEDVSVVGIWNLTVTVVNCQTGALLRTVHSVQMFQPDGAVSETSSLGNRGSSIGYWNQQDGHTYTDTYYFFRYNADGTLASMAKGANTLTLSSDGNSFTSTGTVQDFDVNGNQLTNGCVTHSAKKL